MIIILWLKVRNYMLKDLGVHCHEASCSLFTNGSQEGKIRRTERRKEREQGCVQMWQNANSWWSPSERSYRCSASVLKFPSKWNLPTKELGEGRMWQSYTDQLKNGPMIYTYICQSVNILKLFFSKHLKYIKEKNPGKYSVVPIQYL